MDLNKTAFRIVQSLTDTDQGPGREIRTKRSSAGRRGGSARAKVLSPERRKEIAAKAIETRWRDRK